MPFKILSKYSNSGKTRTWVLLLVSIFFCTNVFGQVDSIKLVAYSPGFRFAEGIYLNHQQLVNNAPIPKSRILSNFDKNGFDFYEKLLGENKIAYFDMFGIRKEVNVSDIWGFCRRGSVFINWGDDFTRITVLGNICHFVSSLTVVENRYYPGSSNYAYNYYDAPSTTSHTEIRQFVMHFESGKIMEYTIENVEILLMADTVLYDEFMQLKKKKKKDLKFLFVRKFNEKHPIYIPVN